jgi:hypothetical protein
MINLLEELIVVTYMVGFDGTKLNHTLKKWKVKTSWVCSKIAIYSELFICQGKQR